MPNKALKSGFFATFSGQNAKVRGKSLKSDFFAIPPDKTQKSAANHSRATFLSSPRIKRTLPLPF
jgi:hypothetical protein